MADDIRAALNWSLDHAHRRADAFRLASLLASLTFTRGRPSEAQHRYEQAAILADDPALVADALRSAAGAASSRLVGNDALRLWRAAADVAIAAGDEIGAARDLGFAATLCWRGPGGIEDVPPSDVVRALVEEARKLGHGAPAAEAVILTAEAFGGDEVDPRMPELGERARALAQELNDPIQESAALDALSAIHLGTGELPAALAEVLRRTELLGGLRPRAVTGHEHSDCYVMASEISLTVGNLVAALEHAESLARLPFLREAEHLANARQLKVEALSGDWPTLVARAGRFRRGWIRAGRPVAATLTGPALAVASVMDMRGDDEGREEWREIASVVVADHYQVHDCSTGYAPTYDAIALLHRGDFDAAVARLEIDPGEFDRWYNGQLRPWYAALWAEAAVCAGHPDAPARLQRARQFVAANPIAAAMVDRAAAFAARDRAGLLAAAAQLDAVGCRYQWARTLAFAGGDERAEGEVVLAAIGAVPMATDLNRG